VEEDLVRVAAAVTKCTTIEQSNLIKQAKMNIPIRHILNLRGYEYSGSLFDIGREASTDKLCRRVAADRGLLVRLAVRFDLHLNG
jgi:hypothetical protein